MVGNTCEKPFDLVEDRLSSRDPFEWTGYRVVLPRALVDATAPNGTASPAGTLSGNPAEVGCLHTAELRFDRSCRSPNYVSARGAPAPAGSAGDRSHDHTLTAPPPRLPSCCWSRTLVTVREGDRRNGYAGLGEFDMLSPLRAAVPGERSDVQDRSRWPSPLSAPWTLSSAAWAPD